METISFPTRLDWKFRIASSPTGAEFVNHSIKATPAIRIVVWVGVSLFFLGGICLRAADTAESAARSLSPTLLVGVATNSAIIGTNTSYVLSVNDLIRVEVYKEDDLRAVTRIDQDGTVFLPLIETVKIGGRSVAEARDVVRQLYEKDYLKAAHVTITLVESSQTNVVAKPKALKFTILGEVKKPGNIEMPEGEKLDIVRAIGMAEGFTGLANKRSVTVNRKGDPKPHDVDVQALTRDPKAKPFEVKPGDVIEVRQTIF